MRKTIMAFECKGVKISFCKGVYEPAEDTFLLLDALEKEKWLGTETVLEVGAGTGIVSIFLSKKVKKVYSLDINPRAAMCTKKNAAANKARNIRVFCSDLFGAVGGEKFDAIIFNTPYLPEDSVTEKFADPSWSGGKSGRAVIELFLAGIKGRIFPGGRVFMVESSLSGYEKTPEFLNKNGFTASVCEKRKLFFEELVVIKAKVILAANRKQNMRKVNGIYRNV